MISQISSLFLYSLTWYQVTWLYYMSLLVLNACWKRLDIVSDELSWFLGTNYLQVVGTLLIFFRVGLQYYFIFVNVFSKSPTILTSVTQVKSILFSTCWVQRKICLYRKIVAIFIFYKPNELLIEYLIIFCANETLLAIGVYLNHHIFVWKKFSKNLTQ